MKGRHDTQLVYVHEGGELDVGIVACVPRKGEIVLLYLPDGWLAYRVEHVGWSVHTDAGNAYTLAPSTVVRVSLTRCE